MYSLQLDPGEDQLVQQLIDTLRTLPGVEAEVSRVGSVREGADTGYDVQIDARIGKRPIALFVEVRKAAYPRDIHQSLWRLKALPGRDNSHTAMAMVAATSLSPGAKELLRAEGIGYFDSGGSLCLPAVGAYIFIDNPPPKAAAAGMRSIFTGRRAQAIHALLAHRALWFSVKELAVLGQVSPATASGILTELEKRDWVDTRGRGPSKQRQLREPGALLDAWAAQTIASRAPTMHRYFVPGLKAEALVDRAAQVLEARNANYAISHEAAAQRYAPYLSSVGQVRCRALMAQETKAALADLEARAVDEGANLVLIEVNSAGDLLFRERVGNAWLASPIHVYLDLLKGEGRAKEMAEHLRKQKIGY
jgi:hypothetical protein